MKTMRARDIDRLCRSDADVLLLDVLPEEHFRQEHLPSALNAPLDSEDFVEQARAFADDLEQPVIVYCTDSDCPLSAQAGQKLEAAGFEHVIDMEGGLAEWKEEGLPLEP